MTPVINQTHKPPGQSDLFGSFFERVNIENHVFSVNYTGGYLQYVFIYLNTRSDYQL